MSGLSLLNKHEMERNFGYPDFAEALREKGDTEGSAELFKRMLFNIAVRNTDDHAKNHGFISNNNSYCLSPAFDITPTSSKEGLSTEFDLALNVGRQGRLASIDNAFSVFQRFGITEAEAIKSLNDVVVAVSQWRDAFDYYGVSGSDVDLFSFTFDSAAKRLMLSSESEDDDQWLSP